MRRDIFCRLEVDGFAVSGHTRFFEGFAESGVSVACASYVLARRAVLECEDRFCYHFSGVLCQLYPLDAKMH